MAEGTEDSRPVIKSLAPSISTASIRGDLLQMARQALDREHEATLESLHASQLRYALEHEAYMRKQVSEDDAHARLHTLEDEIHACRQALASVRMRRNSLAPAAILPYDILALVFESLALKQPPGLASYCNIAHAQEAMLGWITVTHVCSRWRQVALDVPTLWSTVTPELGDMWFNLLLTRSRSTPISVDLCTLLSNSKEQDRLEILTDHLPRLRNLTVRGPFDSIDSWFFPRPVPQLLTLRLHSSFSPKAPMRFSVPVYKLANLPPTLREISFSNFTFSWDDISSSQSLTHLTVTISTTWPRVSSGFESDKFLDFLERSPNLESLILITTDLGLDGHRPSTRIRLPRLSELVLREQWANVAWLLDRIELPVWTRLRLHAKFPCHSLDDNLYLLRSLAPVLSTGVVSPLFFRTLSVEFNNRGLRVVADPRSAGEGSPPFTPLEHGPCFCVRLGKYETHTHDNSNLPTLFLHLFNTLALGDLQALSVDLEGSEMLAPLNARDWALVLSQCASVVHLRVYGTRAAHIFAALGCRHRDQGLGDSETTAFSMESQDFDPPILSYLRSLAVRDIDEDEDTDTFFEAPWYTRLLLALKTRNSVLPNLQLLDVGHSTFNESQLTLFEDVVEEVVWDGDVLEPDEDYTYEDVSDVWEDHEGGGSDEADSPSDEEELDGLGLEDAVISGLPLQF